MFKSFKFNDILVTPSFRSEFFRLFDNLKPDDRCNYARFYDFAAYVLFGTYYEKDTDKLLLPRELLYSMGGCRGSSHDWSAKTFLDKFSDKVFQLDFSSFSFTQKTVRVLNSAKIPEWLLNARAELMLSRPEDRTMYLVSGLPGLNESLFARRLGVAAEVAQVKNDAVKFVLETLNGLEENLFKGIVDRIPGAMAEANRIESEQARMHQTAILFAVASNPVPVYKPSTKSTRVFTKGASFLNLRSELRDSLVADWTKLDLKYSQLNIISSRWSATGVRDYLARCPSGLWHEFASSIDTKLDAQVKSSFKTAVYSVIFGSVHCNVRQRLEAAFDPKRGKIVLESPLVEALFAARENQIKNLKLMGYAMDAFESRRDLIKGVSKREQNKDARSILACVAQSYEMAILAPVVKYISDACTEECPIYCTAFLHDGIWIKCDDAIQLQVHLKRIREIISEVSLDKLQLEMTAEIEIPLHLRLDAAA